MKTLLPSGCYDVLPPLASAESALSTALLGVFASYGYEQVAPPLLEYSDNLLAGRGAELGAQMFRVMDPASNRVMGIRPDITLQIARIAAGPLKDAPRPLRLCYNGLILRLQGEQLKTDRQLRQAGIELIGASSPAADAEVILIAARALAKVGVSQFTIDLNLPSIVSVLVEGDNLGPDTLAQLYTALASKDTTALENFTLTHKQALLALVRETGDAQEVLATLSDLKLPDAARSLCNNLRVVVDMLSASKEPGVTLTIDATESQGYAYHSGIGFNIFVPGVAYEVGRGGRYHVDGEEATGFTLYVEALRGLLPAAKTPEKKMVPPGTSAQECEKLHAQGYVTIFTL